LLLLANSILNSQKQSRRGVATGWTGVDMSTTISWTPTFDRRCS